MKPATIHYSLHYEIPQLIPRVCVIYMCACEVGPYSHITEPNPTLIQLALILYGNVQSLS